MDADHPITWLFNEINVRLFNMKKLALIALIPLVLTACGESEKVYTAKELTYDITLMKNVWKTCAEDPARNQNKPNCINGGQASRVYMTAGCHRGDVVNKECLDKYWAK